MNAVYGTIVDRLLNRLFRSAEGIEDLRQIFVIHPEYIWGRTYAELATDADILVYIRLVCHRFPHASLEYLSDPDFDQKGMLKSIPCLNRRSELNCTG